jgi:trans-2-enoyl-CoA reductase
MLLGTQPMRAVQQARFGPPAEVLELVDQQLPSLGDNEVSIGVEATPIHTGDLANIAGDKTMIRTVTPGEELVTELPQVPGIEGIGRVTAVGAAVSRFAIGDRVYLPLQCGSWREVVHGDAGSVFPAPEGDPIQLSLIINAFTADIALQDLAPLKPGDWFVQNSANSNVGRVLITLAHRRGFKTLNIVRREALVDELLELGADVVLVDGPDLAARVAEATDGAPLPVGLDGVGGEATGQLAACLDDEASVYNMGHMSSLSCQIPSWVLLYKQVKIRGFYAGYNISSRSPEQQAAMIEELAGLIGSGVLKAKIAATYPLTEFRQAVTHAMQDGVSRDGKIVFDLTS